MKNYPPATNRFLAWYAAARETFRCRVDQGCDSAVLGSDKPSEYEYCGSSYRFNWYLEDNYSSLGLAQDFQYNLAGKKESWAPEPSRFIRMHETSAFPWELGTSSYWYVYEWHYSKQPGKVFDLRDLKTDPDKLVAPILFVDGHSKKCDFTAIYRDHPSRALEPTSDWIWYKPVRR